MSGIGNFDRVGVRVAVFLDIYHIDCFLIAFFTAINLSGFMVFAAGS